MKSHITAQFKNRLQTYSPAFIDGLNVKLQSISEQYNIFPLFAGLFGSRVKGYSGPNSDFDFYVPYVKQAPAYLKAFFVDIEQVEGKDTLPPQITFELVDGNQTHSVQLNFEDFPHYAQQLSLTNIDFKFSLSNIAVFYCNSSVLSLLSQLYHQNLDMEKMKHQCLGRVSKTSALLKNKGYVKSSEIMDSLYRLFLASYTTRKDNARICVFPPRLTLLDLVEAYEDEYGSDVKTINLVDALLEKVVHIGVDENWSKAWSDEVVTLLDNVQAKVKERPVVKIQHAYLLMKPEQKLQLINKINVLFSQLVLEANEFKTVDKTRVM